MKWTTRKGNFEADTKKELKRDILNTHCAKSSTTSKFQAGRYKLELTSCSGEIYTYILEGFKNVD